MRPCREGCVLGTGNSGANYMPLRNCLAVLEEGCRWHRARLGDRQGRHGLPLCEPGGQGVRSP